MSAFLWHVIADTTGNRLGILDEEKSDLYKGSCRYAYHNRTPYEPFDQSRFQGWPHSTLGNMGDGLADMSTISPPFENINAMYHTGAHRLYFVVGVVRDGSGNVVAAANIDLFLTATDTLVSSTWTDSNGIYSAFTPYVGQNHYATANYGPNTLVGMSVNTLQPGNNPWG